MWDPVNNLCNYITELIPEKKIKMVPLKLFGTVSAPAHRHTTRETECIGIPEQIQRETSYLCHWRCGTSFSSHLSWQGMYSCSRLCGNWSWLLLQRKGQTTYHQRRYKRMVCLLLTFTFTRGQMSRSAVTVWQGSLSTGLKLSLIQ